MTDEGKAKSYLLSFREDVILMLGGVTPNLMITLHTNNHVILFHQNIKSSFWYLRRKYPMTDRGDYVAHPRGYSNRKNDFDDPIKVYISSAENQVRRGWITHPKLATTSKFVLYNYIENKKLEKQFLVRKSQKNAHMC
jgi:hypothetical protein